MYLDRNSFRLIVAGGGTGGVTLFNGEQLNKTNGEILYIDFSIASMKISQRRARTRNIKNIIWVQSWIEGVIYHGIGVFEELQCSGVLHHLKSPIHGLRLLKDLLNPRVYGGVGLMVYAKYGRTGVYQMQDLLRLINTNQIIQEEIDAATKTLNILPMHNRFSHTQSGDHKTGKIGTYDLLLHKRDIAFSISSLFQWVEKGGLYIIDVDNIPNRFLLNLSYGVYESHLTKVISNMNRVKQWSIMEVFHGRSMMHSFYASTSKYCVADINDPLNRLYMYGNPHGFREAVSNKRNVRIIGNETIFLAWMSRINLRITEINFKELPYAVPSTEGLRFRFKWNNFNRFIVNRLLDSNQGISVKIVCSEYRKTLNYSISTREVFRQAVDFYDSVKDTEMFLLRKHYVGLFPKTAFQTYFQIKSI